MHIFNISPIMLNLWIDMLVCWCLLRISVAAGERRLARKNQVSWPMVEVVTGTAIKDLDRHIHIFLHC